MQIFLRRPQRRENAEPAARALLGRGGYHSVPGNALTFGWSPVAAKTPHSRLAAVLQVMRFQLGFGGLFPTVEKGLLQDGQAAQTRQIASARLGFAKSIDEPFAFLTAYPSGSKSMHSAPVENREAEDSNKANKRQTLFSLKIRLRKSWRPANRTST
jgi:hypothetical protein